MEMVVKRFKVLALKALKTWLSTPHKGKWKQRQEGVMNMQFQKDKVEVP